MPPLGRGFMRPLPHDEKSVLETLHFNPSGSGSVALMKWYEAAVADGTMDALTCPDYHRLQIEKWIFDRSLALMGGARSNPGEEQSHDWARRRAVDFGVIEHRAWQDEGRYSTAGISGREDYRIDLTQSIPAEHPLFGACDLVICSEVLEHVKRPFDAVDTMFYLLKPGGTLLITSPFIWPDHATPDYPDYWRFTEGVWRLLMEHADLEIKTLAPCKLTYHGGHLWNLMRVFECFGFSGLVETTTGYMVEAVKPLNSAKAPGARPMPAKQNG